MALWGDMALCGESALRLLALQGRTWMGEISFLGQLLTVSGLAGWASTAAHGLRPRTQAPLETSALLVGGSLSTTALLVLLQLACAADAAAVV